MAQEVYFQYSFNKGAHTFIGLCRYADGIMVGGNDLKQVVDEVGRKLEEHLPAEHSFDAAARCTIPEDQLEETLKGVKSGVVAWVLDAYK